MMSLSLTRNEFKNITLALLLAICGSLGVDIHLASLPILIAHFHTNAAAMQMSVTLYLLGAAISMLIYGPWSDHVGRRPVIFTGLIIAVLGNYAITQVTTINSFLVLRFVQGVGCGVSYVIGRTIAGDLMRREKLAAIGSFLTFFLSLSPAIAPLLGSYV